jgi:DNA-binding NarL/FixJ family response regulator
MSHENGTSRDSIRIFVCGSCDGSSSLVEALAHEPDFELVGVAQAAQESTGVLAGGHLNVVLLATDSQTLPGDELAVVREHTRAPVVIIASGEATQLLDQALDADVADVLLLPQLTDNVIFAIRKASRARSRSTNRSVRCCSTWTSSSGTRRSCSDSSRKRPSTTSFRLRESSTRRSSPATRRSTRAGSTSCRRRSARRTPSS